MWAWGAQSRSGWGLTAATGPMLDCVVRRGGGVAPFDRPPRRQAGVSTGGARRQATAPPLAAATTGDVPRGHRSGGVVEGTPLVDGLTLLPQAPDGPDNEAFERPERLAFGLALGDTPLYVGPCLGGVTRLREGNAIEDGVEATVTAAVQAVAHPSRRGRFERGDPGVGGELGVRGETSPGAQDAGEGARRQRAFPAERGQGEKPASARASICAATSCACSRARRKRRARRCTAAARSCCRGLTLDVV